MTSSFSAQDVFDAMAARGDIIAFRFLAAGCECRAQLMIELMQEMGITPKRAWALAVGRDLAFQHQQGSRGTIVWRNHTAPTILAAGVEHGVVVIDPSTQAGPVTLEQWALSMRARSFEVSEVPLSQAEILTRQSARVLRGQEMDAIVFSLELGQAPIPEKGGSGFRIEPDPPEGVSAFAHEQMQQLLARQRLLGPGRS